MADVFISYSRRDKEFVRSLHDALQERGRETWVDWEGIPPSAEWLKEIYTAIEAAETVIFIISPHSVASRVCIDEVAHAVRNNKRLVPILRGDVDSDAVPKPVRERNWIFSRETDDFASAFASLMSALDTDLDWVRAHTRLLTRAREWDANRRDYSFALRGSDLQRAEQYPTEQEGKDPKLLPLQIEYILASRRDVDKRRTRALGLGALALTMVIVFGLLFWQKRIENNLSLAAEFREKGISELASRNPLTAEVLLARALTIHDVADTRQLLLQARSKSARLLWISPPRAGSAIVAVSANGAFAASHAGSGIEVWSLDERRTVRTVPTGQNVQAAAFSPDNRLLAIAGEKEIELWTTERDADRPIRTIANVPGVLALAFGPGGKLLISGRSDRSVTVWNLDNPGPPLRLQRHSNNVSSVVVSADGRVLASGSLDNNVKVWGLPDGDEQRTLVGHDDAVLSVALSPNGELVASGGWDNKIWLWDRRTGRKLRVLEGHTGGILSLAFSPDGAWLVSGSEDRTARLWDVETGRNVVTLPGHQDYVAAVAFVGAEGHHRVVTSDVAGVLRLWDVDSIGQRDELTTLRGHEGPVSAFAFSPDGRLLASGSWDKSIRLWDLQARKVLIQLAGPQDAVTAVQFSPDGRRLAVASKDSTVRLWHTATWAPPEVLNHREDGDNAVRDIAFSPDGRFLVSGSDDGKIRIWNADDGSLVKAVSAHTQKIQGLAFSPDGRLLATASEDTKIGLWQVVDWTKVRDFEGHAKGVWQVAFSRDGRYLLSASDDRTARLWDVGSGRQALPPMEHERAVWSVDFSADGKTIATGCADATVHIRDIAFDGPVPTLDNHTVLRISDGPVWYVKFNRDPGDVMLGMGGLDKTIRIFNVRRFRMLFADPARLETDARQEGGLQVRPGQSAPDVVPVAQQDFVPVPPSPDHTAAIDRR